MYDAAHAVLVRIRLSDDDLGTTGDDDFVEIIENAVCEAMDKLPRVGYVDGHEFGGGWAVIFCYGCDASELRERIYDVLLRFELQISEHLTAEIARPEPLKSMIVLTSRRTEQRDH